MMPALNYELQTTYSTDMFYVWVAIVFLKRFIATQQQRSIAKTVCT